MATTGVGFSNLFAQKTDSSYSDYLNNTKKAQLFKEGLITAIEHKYDSLGNQDDYDDITAVIKTNTVFNLANNQLYTSPLLISTITFVGTTVTVTTTLPHNLIPTQAFTIAGALGLTNVNGSFSVSSVTSTTIFVFTALALPVGAYTANSGSITYSSMISDYMHLLGVKAKFLKNINVSITNASNATPIRIKLNTANNNIRSTELINITGVVGNTAANGTYYAKKINSVTVDLYSDISLLTGVAGNGTYVSGGTITEVFYKYCTPYYSERKIASLTEPVISAPKFEIANNLLKIYPLNYTCQEITADYISDAIVYIDPTNNVLDLEAYYPFKFLSYVADVCKDIYFGNVENYAAVQKSQLDLKQNP